MPGLTQRPGSEADTHMAEQVVALLLEKGIRLLALDFDQTLISIHTAGAWRQGAKTLVQHIRPCFKALVPVLLKNNIFVGIATFSKQPDLIQEVLQESFPHSPTEKIVIQATTQDWIDEQRRGGGIILGKEQHIAAIITELYNRCHAIIHPEEILLFDDNYDNVRTAVEFRHRGFQIKDDVSLDSLKRYISII